MSSKFGLFKYGSSLYSAEGWTLLEGVPLSLSVFLNGSFTESEPFVGNITFTVSVAGIFRSIEGLRGQIDITPILGGDMFRARTVKWEGTLPISVVPEGSLQRGMRLESHDAFYVLIGGGVDIYLGPFWDPDEPEDGFWVPDVPGGEFWVPIPEEQVWG